MEHKHRSSWLWMWFDYQKRMSPLRGTAPTGLLWLGLVSLGAAADELFPFWGQSGYVWPLFNADHYKLFKSHLNAWPLYTLNLLCTKFWVKLKLSINGNVMNGLFALLVINISDPKLTKEKLLKVWQEMYLVFLMPEKGQVCHFLH